MASWLQLSALPLYLSRECEVAPYVNSPVFFVAGR